MRRNRTESSATLIEIGYQAVYTLKHISSPYFWLKKRSSQISLCLRKERFVSKTQNANVRMQNAICPICLGDDRFIPAESIYTYKSREYSLSPFQIRCVHKIPKKKKNRISSRLSCNQFGASIRILCHDGTVQTNRSIFKQTSCTSYVPIHAHGAHIWPQPRDDNVARLTVIKLGGSSHRWRQQSISTPATTITVRSFVSVDRGIGPFTSEMYINDRHIPTDYIHMECDAKRVCVCVARVSSRQTVASMSLLIRSFTCLRNSSLRKILSLR